MAVIFNQAEVAGVADGAGLSRQSLLNAARIPGTAIRLDRLALAKGATTSLTVADGSVAWLQVLGGEATLTHDANREALSDAVIAFLPPGFSGHVQTVPGVTFLVGEIPNAAQLDPQITHNPPPYRLTDWTREPVLNSEHDARKRIYLVTPKLSGTKAVKGEMILYPPGTAAANHHHEGAEHFMYVLRGRGTVYANEQPFPVRQGDVIYYPDRERHYLEAAADEELVFAEFFAPGEFKTIWVDESQVCAWLPTGSDIRGRAPVRAIKAHTSAPVEIPQDV